MPVDHPSETYEQRVSLRTAEFAALRRTVAGRGTARMVIMPVTCAVWATLAVVLFLFGQVPTTSLLPLAVLVGGFEAIHALHVGAERIGRYLQVKYEAGADGPQWETAAMTVGPALPALLALSVPRLLHGACRAHRRLARASFASRHTGLAAGARCAVLTGRRSRRPL